MDMEIEFKSLDHALQCILLDTNRTRAAAWVKEHVTALIEAAQDASALLDLVAGDTAIDVSGVADTLDVALAALEADQ